MPKLIELAKSDPGLDGVACSVLAQMASDSPQATGFLVASLRDGDGKLKMKVVNAFMNAGFTPPEAVPLLVTRLENSVPPAQGSSLPLNEMSALRASGPEAAPAAPFLTLSREGQAMPSTHCAPPARPRSWRCHGCCRYCEVTTKSRSS